MKTVSLREAFEMVYKEICNPSPPRPCVMCGKPTRFDTFRQPVCYPYAEDGLQVVATCKWDYAEKRRKENWL